MNTLEFQQTLANLRAQADGAAFTDPASRERLHALIAELELTLHNPAALSERSNLIDRVSVAMLEFEAEHPTMSGVLSRINGMLSAMGV